MNLTKKVGLAAAFMLTSSFASAAVYNIGSGSNVYTVSSIGEFTDTFNFTLNENSSFTATGLSSLVAGLSGDALFTSIELGGHSFPLYSGYIAQTGLLNLVAGDYSVILKGLTTVGSSEYRFTSDFLAGSAVSAVPEPSSIALMLGGLGLVGFMAARRAKKA